MVRPARPAQRLPDVFVVTLTADVADVIAREARGSADGTETGGIVLGHDRDGELVVTIVGGPGPAALRTPNLFKRDLAHAQALADDAYDRDGSVWIGEWHTHPAGPAAPSAVDLNTYAAHLADPSLGFDRFLSIIVLPCAEHGWQHVSAVAWVVEGDTAHLAELRTEAAQ
jgi:integrative and conjugative element protein (TIGR02256 family)